MVLGGGGLTGIAWLHGVLDAMPPVVGTADRVVGTSAGGLLATRLLLGGEATGLRDHVEALAGVRFGPAAVARLIAAQLWPSRRHGLQWLGRASARRSTSMTEDEFVALVAAALGSTHWPETLVLVAVDTRAGRPAYFTRRSGVELPRAVAASCAMPGVFPAVTIDGRRYSDGGLRSPANADLASGCERVLILAPQGRSVRPVRRPSYQAERLRAEGAEVVLLQAVRPEIDVMASGGMQAALDRGRAEGRTITAEVAALWAES